jgi:hypothetical protein
METTNENGLTGCSSRTKHDVIGKVQRVPGRGLVEVDSKLTRGGLSARVAV